MRTAIMCGALIGAAYAALTLGATSGGNGRGCGAGRRLRVWRRRVWCAWAVGVADADGALVASPNQAQYKADLADESVT
jgi:hypothetical protein